MTNDILSSPQSPESSSEQGAAAARAARPPRATTLRVVDLLSTRIQSVRIELVGKESSTFTRMGAVLVYLPLLLVGYLLMLASVMRLFAALIGWGLTLFIFGAVHLALSAWGISRGRGPGAAKAYDVVDPEVATATQAIAVPPPPAASGGGGTTEDRLQNVRRRAAAEAPPRRQSASMSPVTSTTEHSHPHPVPQPPRTSGVLPTVGVAAPGPGGRSLPRP